MSFSAIFIRRPVATTLLTLGVSLAGGVAFFLLPVAPLPQVDFPTISVQGSLPGGSPSVVATSVATPLERHLGQIADVTEMTSSSTVGSTRVTLQFGLDRDINGAARDVQAAINAAHADLPASLRTNPTYRKVNPADAPIMILALTSSTLTPGPDLRCRLFDHGAEALAGRTASARSPSAAARCRRCARSSTRARSSNTGSGSRTCARHSPRRTPTARRDRWTRERCATRSTTTTRRPRPTNTARSWSPIAMAPRCGSRTWAR